LKFQHNLEEIEQIINMMMFPSLRPNKLSMDGADLFKNAEQIDLSYFFN
jgi:hypothetical protein